MLKSVVSESSQVAVGDSVRGIYPPDKKQYSAKVADISADGQTITLNWDDGDPKHRVLPASQVIKHVPCDQANASPDAPSIIPSSTARGMGNLTAKVVGASEIEIPGIDITMMTVSEFLLHCSTKGGPAAGDVLLKGKKLDLNASLLLCLKESGVEKEPAVPEKIQELKAVSLQADNLAIEVTETYTATLYLLPRRSAVAKPEVVAVALPTDTREPEARSFSVPKWISSPHIGVVLAALFLVLCLVAWGSIVSVAGLMRAKLSAGPAVGLATGWAVLFAGMYYGGLRINTDRVSTETHQGILTAVSVGLVFGVYFFGLFSGSLYIHHDRTLLVTPVTVSSLEAPEVNWVKKKITGVYFDRENIAWEHKKSDGSACMVPMVHSTDQNYSTYFLVGNGKKDCKNNEIKGWVDGISTGYIWRKNEDANSNVAEMIKGYGNFIDPNLGYRLIVAVTSFEDEAAHDRKLIQVLTLVGTFCFLPIGALIVFAESDS